MTAKEAAEIAENYLNSRDTEELRVIYSKIKEAAKAGGREIKLYPDGHYSDRVVKKLKSEGYEVDYEIQDDRYSDVYFIYTVTW